MSSISFLHFYWTYSFVCHLNSTESIQSCSHFGALNLLYTLPSLSYQVLIFTWVKWNIWGLSALPKGTTTKQCPNIEGGETWYFSGNPAPSGIRNRTAGSDTDKATRSNHWAISLWRYWSFVSTLSARGVRIRRLKTVRALKKIMMALDP